MLRSPLSSRVQFLFWCGGVLLCCLATWQYLAMRHFQAAANRRLKEALQTNTPAPLLPSQRPSANERAERIPGSLIGRIEIPRLNLSAVVLEGSDNDVLSLGVGRVPETSEPGEAGNVVLGGHRDTFFRPLSGIRNGDSIRIVTPLGSYRYTVDWMKVVDPENTTLLKATPERSLTLVTCYPFHYVGPAPRRFIVRAHQEMEASTPGPAIAADGPRNSGVTQVPHSSRSRARGSAIGGNAVRLSLERSRPVRAHRYTGASANTKSRRSRGEGPGTRIALARRRK